MNATALVKHGDLKFSVTGLNFTEMGKIFVHGFNQTSMDITQLDQISSISDALSAVGMMQKMYSSENTDEMKARGQLIRTIIPNFIDENISFDFLYPIHDLRIQGKDGVGRRAEVPWVRMFSVAFQTC